MAAQTSEQWKAKGNDHFGAGKYSLAVDCYTKAIQAHASNPAEGNIAIYFSNRSAAFFNLKKLNEALDDATNAIKLDKTYVKAYVRQSTVLTSLGRTRDALRAILAAKLVPGSETDVSVQDKIKSCWTNYVTGYFRLLTRSIHVEVKWINEKMGRGVFNAKPGVTDENIIIFQEKPLLSHIRPGSPLACAHCMHTKMTTDTLKPHYDSQIPFMYPNLENGEHKWFECEDCGEKYCTAACRGLAVQHYHHLLCTKSSWWVQAHQADPIAHPVEAITNLSLEGKPAFINPLLISRMMASIIGRIAAKKATQVAIDDALEPFRLFTPSERAGEQIARATITCIRALYHCKYQGQPELLAALDGVITEDLYHELHGIITRNAHHLNPLSDFHLHLESLNKFNQHLLASHYAEDITPMELVQTDWMRGLTVEGTGLFEVANSMNHSCEPNASVVHCDADHTISIVSKVQINHGVELTISYIDETLPKAERQAKLKEFYDFDCACPKCLSEA